MSNSVFQSVMVQLKDVTDREFGVIDAEGFVVSSTDLTLQGERWPDAVGHIAGVGRDPHQIASRAGRSSRRPAGAATLILDCGGRCAVGRAGRCGHVYSARSQHPQGKKAPRPP